MPASAGPVVYECVKSFGPSTTHEVYDALRAAGERIEWAEVAGALRRHARRGELTERFEPYLGWVYAVSRR